MIPRTHFRIGNLVYERGTTNPTNIVLLSVYQHQEFTPIPLTEEWLVKFGFEINKHHFTKWINETNTFIIMFDDRKKNYFICDCPIDCNIKFVHQLQNLYFALTGEELEIKK